MTKIPNLTLLLTSSESQLNTLSQADCFGHWRLEFEIYLYFGAWNLEFFRRFKCIG